MSNDRGNKGLARRFVGYARDTGRPVNLALTAGLAVLWGCPLGTRAFGQLDSSCTIRVGAWIGGVGSDGSWRISNIAVLPDPMRAEATCSRPDVTLYGASAFFDILNGQVIAVDHIPLSPTPVPGVVSLSTPPNPVNLNLSSGSPTAQLSVTANFSNGGAAEVAARSQGTGYRSSNPAIASVGLNGLVTGVSPGTAYITATNQGATTVKKVTVARDFTSTTVEGFVQLPDGTGVNDAIVRATLGVETMTSGSGANAGHFSFALIDSPVEAQIVLRVLADVGNEAYLEERVIIPVANGITDAGIVVLDDTYDPFMDAIAREFAVYNNTYIDMINDAAAREFSVYNNAYQDQISDVIAREFSVYNEP